MSLKPTWGYRLKCFNLNRPEVIWLWASVTPAPVSPLTSPQVPTISNFSLSWIHLTPLGSCSLCLFCLFLLSSSSSYISLCWLPQDPLEFSAQLQCLPYLLKLYVYELSSPTKHRDFRTVIVLFCFCILVFSAISETQVLMKCLLDKWISFNYASIPSNTKCGGETTLPPRASCNPDVQWFYKAASKVTETNHLGFIDQKGHKCLLSTSCWAYKSRPLFASVPQSSTFCDSPTRDFLLEIPSFAQNHISLTQYPE